MPRYVFIDNFDGKLYGDLADLDRQLYKLSASALPPAAACRILDHIIDREGRGYTRPEGREAGWMPNRRVSGYLVYLCNDFDLVPLAYDSEDSTYIGAVRRHGTFIDFVSVRRDSEDFERCPYVPLPDVPGWGKLATRPIEGTGLKETRRSVSDYLFTFYDVLGVRHGTAGKPQLESLEDSFARFRESQPSAKTAIVGRMMRNLVRRARSVLRSKSQRKLHDLWIQEETPRNLLSQSRQHRTVAFIVRSVEAAVAGNPYAQCALGLLHASVYGDRFESVAWKWLTSAAEHGVGEAMQELGRQEDHFEDRLKRRQRLNWLKQAADQGFPEAQFALARDLRLFPSAPTDLVAAAEIFEQLSRSGNTQAKGLFAEMLFNGEFGVKDDVKAFELALEAAREGTLIAQTLVGCMYLYAWGTNEDPAEAVRWLEKAADRGSARAMCLLAVALENLTVMFEDGGAYSWYEAAAEHGDDEARNRLQQLDNEVSQEPDFI